MPHHRHTSSYYNHLNKTPNMKTITLRRPSCDETTGSKTRRIAKSVYQSIATLWILCANQAIIASRKIKDNSKISPSSPMIQRPKKLIVSISNKAMRLSHRKKRNTRDEDEAKLEDDGLWQREILMGDKCQPLDFSGVIYYDKDGKRTDEYPMRSPKASPFNGYVPSPRASPFPGYETKFDWVPPHER
ncbi:hypothetical protein CTI12_AA324700 [Artemisia annua]|uniref:Uncharacterized protein n=1 Tax=Artemisia annua TaxID=35608 RepID=A0A2U1N083_ARTAN|nr:hypothetical protein CTI12_AA324700 [Artemisia annua]